MLWYIRTLGGGTDTTVAGESLVLLLGGTGLGLLLHPFLVLRGLALLRVHLLHWARLGLRSNLSARVELWYKSYSGGWCTWPTPLKYAESKFKYTEA